MTQKQKHLRMANGLEPAERVLKNARYLNVFTGEWLHADIAIADGIIVGVGEYQGIHEVDCSDGAVVPGFIDAHMHIESTMLTPRHLVAQVVASGTTTLIADPHEIANVCGADGIRFILDQAAQLPINVFVMMPSCVPATRFERGGAVMNAADLAQFHGKPHVLGLGEVMDYPGVCSGDSGLLDKLDAFCDTVADGHAPMVAGRALQAYCVAGIDTEHECQTADETIEKMRAGLSILAREGSAAHNVEAVCSAILKAGYSFDRVAFCTDDKHMEDIQARGHIRENILLAIQCGVPVETAYAMASLHAARIYGLKRIGAIAPGYRADMVLLDDAEAVTVRRVMAGGKWADELPDVAPKAFPEALCNTVRLPQLSADLLRLPVKADLMPVVELIPWQIATHKGEAHLPQKDGLFVSDKTFQKLAVLERYGRTGHCGVGAVTGFCLHGAIAATVAHDSHNLIVLGDSDDDMLLAAKQLESCGGGYTLVCEGKVLDTLPLPVAGLMTDESTDTVQETVRRMKNEARAMGVPECYDPFITLSFLSLPVIPEIRVTVEGIFDVTAQAYYEQA